MDTSVVAPDLFIVMGLLTIAFVLLCVVVLSVPQEQPKYVRIPGAIAVVAEVISMTEPKNATASIHRRVVESDPV
jgi:hypothetical protein